MWDQLTSPGSNYLRVIIISKTIAACLVITFLIIRLSLISLTRNASKQRYGINRVQYILYTMDNKLSSSIEILGSKETF